MIQSADVSFVDVMNGLDQVRLGYAILGASLYSFGLLLDVSRDAGAKLLSVEFAIAQIVFFRVLFDVIFSLVGALRSGGLHILWPVDPLIHVLKACAMGLGVYLVYASLALLPLVEVSGILLMAPIFTAGLSHLTLNETADMKSLTGIFFGLVGGLLILGPSSNEYGGALALPVLASVCIASATVCNRRLCSSNNNWSIIFSAGILIMLAIMPLAISAWRTPDLISTMLLLSLGVAGTIASYCHVYACRLTPVSFLAPFAYTEWLFAAMLGWIVWADVPRVSAWLGCACIVAGNAIALARRSSNRAISP